MTYGSQAAAASQVFEQQRDLALRDRNQQHLELVDAALARLDAGTYGACASCGRPIAPERLEAIPWAAHCIDCQRTAGAGDASTPQPAARRHRRRSAPPPSVLRGVALRTPLVPFGPPDRALVPEGREPPADRRVQDPGRLQRGRVADRRRAGARRHHLLVGQPRPGRRPRGPAARRAVRRRHAVGRARDQARAGRGRRRRDRRRRDRERRAPGRRRADRRASAGWRSSRRSTTTGSSPARARSGWRSSRTSRTSPRCWSRSAAAGWRAASRRPSERWLRRPGSSASSRSWRRTPGTSLAKGEIVRWPAELVSRTIADGTRTQALGHADVRPPLAAARRHRDGQRGGDRRRRPARRRRRAASSSSRPGR